jgi:hypothetical protein
MPDIRQSLTIEMTQDEDEPPQIAMSITIGNWGESCLEIPVGGVIDGVDPEKLAEELRSFANAIEYFLGRP